MASSVQLLVVMTTLVTVSLAKMKIGENTDSGPVLIFDNISFSSWNNSNVTYNSSTGYNAMGMAPLYNIANQVIGLFLGDKVLPDGYIMYADDQFQSGPKVDANEWGDLLKHYWALILVVLMCGIIVVLMPVIGLCFCCCRCVGACGGRSQPFDKKHDTCRRVFMGLLLILTASGMIFGVVVAFATNSYLQQGIHNATTSSRLAVKDTQIFLKTTSSETNHLLNQNYNELNIHLRTMLNETTSVVINKLEEQSKAVSLTQLANFAVALPEIREDLIRLQNITADLRTSASLLSDGLRSVKRELLTSLTKCDAPQCKDVLTKYKIGNLNINGIDYDKLPDLTPIIKDLQKISTGESLDAIKDSQQKLAEIRENLNKTIDEDIKNVYAAIDKAGQEIQRYSSEMTLRYQQISDETGNNTYNNFDIADKYIGEYSKYHFWGGLGVSTVLLVVLLCAVLGLLCGICGKRPDGYGDDCCNKGAGSRFLMCGVAIIFLTISVLTVVALAYFLVGVVLRRGVCIPLEDPTNDQVFRLIDKRIKLDQILHSDNSGRNQPKVRTVLLSEIIDSCHKNQSIYTVLRLANLFDIEDIRKLPDKYGIKNQLSNLIARIQLGKNLQIWPDKAQEAFNKLNTSLLANFDVHRILDNVNETITESNLIGIADKLDQTANEISSTTELNSVQLSLKNQALYLRMYQDKLVGPMTNQSIEMLQVARKIDQQIKFNRTSFKEAMTELLAEVKAAEQFININGTAFVQKVATQLTDRFLHDIGLYLDHVIYKTQNDLGRCGPLSNVYRAMQVAGCNRIIDPFNGFWAGLAWCTLLFLPCIIISVKLSSLYQKSDPYPGPLVESEYLYDAYSERDNIPLANGPKNKRRNKKNERRRSSRDRRGDYYEDSSSPHGPSSSGSRENRYNDMAPKHWNGGPPRYQNPPMAPPASEYERPPPYYFPGAPSEGE